MYPEIYAMQGLAIINAALEVIEEGDFVPKPGIIIPLAGIATELSTLLKLMERIVQELDSDQRLSLVKISTIIEVPRAYLLVDQIAIHADYFFFGNKLI
jgi:pyruvate,orthophosphate dikinase